ncbi:MAG: efflux RND transporter periplasmic adaptor subunit [Verrucomicrobiota bacterium]|nr:efflux RND transporter periplasmic adaptor subunit [Verrucomicrobiota bacterium]
MKKLLPILLLLLLAGGGWFAYSKKPFTATNGPAATERYVARAEMRDIDASVEVSGDVTPIYWLDVKPEVGGKVKALHVTPGASVKAGDLLVEIDDSNLLTERASIITEIDGAKLSMEKTKRNYERAKDLFASKLISREVFDNLSSEFAIAENGLLRAGRKLDILDDKLHKTKVLAPIDGTVLDVPVITGQVVIAAASVNSGTSLMTIADLTRLLVLTHINQVDVARVELNQTVTLRAESLRDLDLEARISFIAPNASVKNNVKGFQVKALIEKPSERLRPGMSVTMTVPIAKVSDAVSVPIAAVFRGDRNERVVYVRNGESTERREVTIGVTNTDHAEVLTGLHAGEEILLVEPSRQSKKRS